MTRKFFLVAGVAALAIAAPASAERGKDRDGRAHASQSKERKAQRSQRAQRPQRAERQRAQRPQRVERQRAHRAERPRRVERQRVQRAERSHRVERQRVRRAERSHRVERQRVQRAERSHRVERQHVRRAERSHRIERQRVQRAERQRAERSHRVERQRIQRADRQRIERARHRIAERIDRRRAIARDNRADRIRSLRQDRRELRARVNRTDRQLARLFNDRPMRKMRFRNDRRIIDIGDRIDRARFSSFVPRIYRARFHDTPDYYYRYDDDFGYLYRVDRDNDFVRAMIPLFGGYGIGDPWPRTYYSSYVPLGYRSYYYDTPNYYYRNDGYGIYRIDAETQLITALVALLAGQSYGVGQYLPASYGVYNVPFAYRSTYYDRNDAWYRYGDGFIYQMDPYNRRISARYPIYGAGYDYLVGQPWPVAYPGYNVPLAYQPLYYDTPQYQYRYANGGIYRIDPTTQVIQALVALVSGQQFGIGQPMPVGYSTYNVPFAYRDRYYDTDDAWYRYANGSVYQVNPVTGLIEESYPIYV